MLGLVVEEYVPYAEAQSNTFRTSDGKGFQCSFWSDVIHLKGAEALAAYQQDYYAGLPAVTRNSFGQGTSFYVGTMPDPHGMDWILKQACDAAGIEPILPHVPAGVEVIQRVNGNSIWLFLLNHSAEKVTVPFTGAGTNLLTDTAVKSSIELEPTDTAIIQLKQ